jgi:hypothetical protein
VSPAAALDQSRLDLGERRPRALERVRDPGDQVVADLTRMGLQRAVREPQGPGPSLTRGFERDLHGLGKRVVADVEQGGLEREVAQAQGREREQPQRAEAALVLGARARVGRALGDRAPVRVLDLVGVGERRQRYGAVEVAHSRVVQSFTASEYRAPRIAASPAPHARAALSALRRRAGPALEKIRLAAPDRGSSTRAASWLRVTRPAPAEPEPP